MGLLHQLLSSRGIVFFQHITSFSFDAGSPLLTKRWRLFGLLRRNQRFPGAQGQGAELERAGHPDTWPYDKDGRMS